MSSFTLNDGARSKFYKNSGKADDSRRRRNENSIELRRQRRNDELMKRRNLQIEFDDSPEDPIMSTSDSVLTVPAVSSAESGDSALTTKQATISIERAVQMLSNNPSVEDLRVAFSGIRRLLSCARNPPIDDVIAAGLLNALAKALQLDDERVQFEAAWALTNIVSGTSEQTAAAVNAGVTSSLVRLCTSSSAKVAEQVIWATANIVGDSPKLRDHMINEGLVPALSHLAANVDKMNASFVQILAWTISNLVRHKRPQASPEVLKNIVPIIAGLLKYPDIATQQDICWALSFMTDGADENMDLALQFNVLPIMVEFLKSGKTELIPPSLRVLGNFATGADRLTQLVVDTKIVETVIMELLVSSNPSNVKECCWLISNITAGTQSQIQYIIDSNVLPLVVEVLKNGDHRSQIEAGWVLANLVHGGTSRQILYLAKHQLTFLAVCQSLAVKNNELIVNMLETLYGLLQVIYANEPENVHKYEIIVEECRGLDHLEALQHHECEHIYNLAYKIVDEFFNDAVDEELQDLASFGNTDTIVPLGENTENMLANDDQMDMKFQF